MTPPKTHSLRRAVTVAPATIRSAASSQAASMRARRWWAPSGLPADGMDGTSCASSGRRCPGSRRRRPGRSAARRGTRARGRAERRGPPGAPRAWTSKRRPPAAPRTGDSLPVEPPAAGLPSRISASPGSTASLETPASPRPTIRQVGGGRLAGQEPTGMSRFERHSMRLRPALSASKVACAVRRSSRTASSAGGEAVGRPRSDRWGRRVGGHLGCDTDEAGAERVGEVPGEADAGAGRSHRGRPRP